MKKTLILFILILPLLLSACGGGTADTPEDSAALTVGEKTYTAADLEKLARAESEFKAVTYIGVPISDLLADAGYSLSDLKAVKAVAVDGFSANYEPSQLMGEDILVAYAQADGPLSEEDGSFRMVLPNEAGKLNVRMLAEIQPIE